jgi:2-methylcitrate dehydratase PrpD
MTGLASEIAQWAVGFRPSAEDLDLASRSLVDTLAVALAARDHPLRRLVDGLTEPCRWAALGHVLDFDDLHVESTTHVSAVCSAATLACGGDARAYLAGAGVMARLGTQLGWAHYDRGWHATCTVGAPGAAVAASVALGLDAEAASRAIALALPGAGGVQGSFGTDGKALQVGFATAAGVRAASLARAGASADPCALEQWMGLVGGVSTPRFDPGGGAVPGGLAMKLFPCCYALQRPIAALQALLVKPLAADDIERVVFRAPAATVQPLIHHRPSTGLEAKFSLEYAVAAVVLDRFPGLASFTDGAVRRPEVAQLVERVELEPAAEGSTLLASKLEVELVDRSGGVRRTHLDLPPGAPGRPATPEQIARKLASCGGDVPALLAAVTWQTAASILRRELSPGVAGRPLT